MTITYESKMDPITIEVVRNKLVGIVREMTTALFRTAYSPIIYEVRDFSNVIMDTEARLVAQAEGIPIFLGAMNPIVEAVIGKFGLKDIHPGDMIISNDPYLSGGTHKNDVNITLPIFFKDELALFAVCKAHWVDIGGKDPGSWSADTSNMYQEGFGIPPLKLYERGKVNDSIMELIFSNVRNPDACLGDLRAQIAACKTGERRILDLLGKYGREEVSDYIDELISHAERVVRAQIKKIPDGVYEVEDYLDSDGVSDQAIRLKMKAIKEDTSITFDFAGTDKQATGGSGNQSFAGSVSAVRVGTKCVTEPFLPGNEGFFNPLRVIAPKGTCVNPTPPAPVTVGLGDLCRSIIEMTIFALTKNAPEKAIAGIFGTVQGMAIGGQDPLSGRHWIYIMPHPGGWGARATKDGMNALCTWVNGDNYNVPCEVTETRFPLLSYISLRQDTGGPGRCRGGLGVSHDYKLLRGEALVSTGLDRYRFKPPGVYDGIPGGTNETVIISPDGKEQRYYKKGGIPITRGCVISHRTGGGGGFGSPLERDPQKVLEDVMNEYVSFESAEKDYRVIINRETSAINWEATQALRKRLEVSTVKLVAE